MTTKPRGLAALKATNPEKFLEIVRKGGSSSSTNFKNRTPEERRQMGAKGGSISRRKYES